MKASICNVHSKSCRFTRWSGKSYSAFNSIGKEISIGVLKSVIAEKLGRKTISFPKKFFFAASGKDLEPYEDPPISADLPLFSYQILLSIALLALFAFYVDDQEVIFFCRALLLFLPSRFLFSLFRSLATLQVLSPLHFLKNCSFIILIQPDYSCQRN